MRARTIKKRIDKLDKFIQKTKKREHKALALKMRLLDEYFHTALAEGIISAVPERKSWSI